VDRHGTELRELVSRASDGLDVMLAWNPIVEAAVRRGARLAGIGAAAVSWVFELTLVTVACAKARKEIRASRARHVWALDSERKRLERNLHDGAQQRLVSLSIALRQARGNVATNPERAEQLLDDAAVELASALRELRELARGLHRAVLSTHGLAPALGSLIERAPFPVHIDVPEARLPEQVETAAYYIVSEALANASKHAAATAAAVVVARNRRSVTVEVADDGSGGADAAGAGLLGLRHRAEALGGSFSVESLPGIGTRIRAVLPLSEWSP
jgi:signal transduction histidine kinase